MIARALALTSVLAASLVSAPLAAQDSTAAQDTPALDTPAVGAGSARLTVRPELRARVERALLAIDSAPSAAFWQGLGAEGLAALVSVLDDASRPVGLRRRAALALRHDRSATSITILESLALRAGEDELVSRNALTALTERRGREALVVIERALGDRRAHVREGAVLAIGTLRERGLIDGARAAASLVRVRAREPELFVRETIDRVLAIR
ncbi:MAG: hypothetical protein J0L92_21885 [Deltaproteobacteria bacterium]|nr:hypothetical protein [Deltaproteobacteria bacterium]